MAETGIGASSPSPTEHELRLLRRAAQDETAIARAQRDFPDNKDVLKYSGIFHFRRGELAAAEDALVKAVVADPGDTEAIKFLMRVYFQAGAYGKCEATAQELLRLAPGDDVAQRTLARILKLKKAEAAAPAEKALADPQNQAAPEPIETEAVASAGGVYDRTVIPIVELTPTPKRRTGLYAGVAAAVLLLAVGGGYFMLASKPVPPDVPVRQDVKVEDTDRMLAERRAADAAIAERRRLEEEQQRQAAAAAEAKRQADEAEAQRAKREADARQEAAAAEAKRKADEAQASAMQSAEAEKKAAAPALSKDDEQNKPEGEAKAPASPPTTAPAAIAPPPDAIAAAPTPSANPYDGNYAGTATFPSGPQPLTLRLVNGEGKGSWNTSCGAAKFTLTIDPNAEANLSVDGFRKDCSKSSQSLRGHVEDGQLKFPTRGVYGDGVVSFAKSGN